MSVAICRGSTAVSLPLEKGVTAMSTPFAASKTWLPSAAARIKNDEQEVGGGEKSTPGSKKLDIWTSIHATKAEEPKGEPYVHPSTRRSSRLMSQRSLAICTESLGSETGSEDFFSSSDDDDMEHSWFSTRPNKQVVQQQVDYDDDDDDDDDDEEETDEFVGMRRKEQDTVNYHCSISRRSPCRSFPPPLPSISRRDGPCFQMRSHRRNGRLVVEAVPVPSQNYLHAERQDGRLLLLHQHHHPP
ncbi:putative protein FAF-like, chloroplastic [Iris pallida]|uniref:FAF domain-containing protein n=1 Tax=Iris pallida TaxID=29817 RepID=A0AAX6EYU0_IRIPA|nr:putative protein FAF-like, chloroplastic [Iris pallida]